MTNGFDVIAATRQMKQAGFSNRQAEAVVGSIIKSRSGMATKQDVAHCWRVILGIILPFLVLILGVLLTK
ncbi:MAG: hypothetical protein OXU31_00930 [Gammaproteobacteria bacterium]|nr:hypothetical protein [Gammaproteobacteria bacterium]MDD9800091.1 hypothetical protein [Gammaproteobacteria bacterium]MDD9814535.1 hypothetical protein [Gammaproteobacteria bacterium]MDD9871280.1 hypothetical protein [Gammaproteobacteria bacterium]